MCQIEIKNYGYTTGSGIIKASNDHNESMYGKDTIERIFDNLSFAFRVFFSVFNWNTASCNCYF